ETYENRGRRYPVAHLERRHEQVLAAIRSAALEQHCTFVDATPYLLGASETALVHGPRDWKHFNRDGYTALSRAAISALPLAAGPLRPRSRLRRSGSWR